MSGRFQGQTDSPLSAEGVEQAQRLARRLRDEPIQAIYSSDLVRARQTAQPIADRTGAPLYIRPQLREIDIGKWAGLTMEEIAAHYAEELEAWRQGDPHVRRGGGESYLEAQQRIVACIEDIVADHLNGQIAVVSHGGTIRALLAHVLDFSLNSLWRLQIANTSLNVLERYGDQWSVRQINDYCHLDHQI
ncbi:MAG: histidine phosphatase family protein [Chloroflexi bacterium]|nr:histidine phosphatase family protein [Chloroflexota bacterium]